MADWEWAVLESIEHWVRLELKLYLSIEDPDWLRQNPELRE